MDIVPIHVKNGKLSLYFVVERGALKTNFIIPEQFGIKLSQVNIERPVNIETTCFVTTGSAYIKQLVISCAVVQRDLATVKIVFRVKTGKVTVLVACIKALDAQAQIE